ncbi:AMP-binding protein [Streptomyces sp. NPDC051214]|uniref:AMP-binding protein n=1 Tax=Streptomyces sp. NPDC051214 TaxID=3155282 RepID=UPI003436E1C9
MPSLTFLASFKEHAGRTPTAPALITSAGVVTYGELAAQATVFGDALRDAHVPADAPVCVYAPTSAATVGLTIACLAEDRPVLLPSAELGEDTLGELVRRAGAEWILAPEPSGRMGDVNVRQVEPQPDHAAGPAVPGGVGLMLTTSGSTGVPKVVPLPRDGVEAFITWAARRFGIGPGTPVLSYAPLNFDLSLLEVWATLAAGGSVVRVDADRAGDGTYLRNLIDGHGVRLVQGVPMLYRLLQDAEPTAPARLTAPRHVLFTGDTMPPKVLAAMPDLFPEARFCNVYGCTETNDSFLYEADRTAMSAGEPLPLGTPLPGVDALVLGADGLPLPGEGTGELVVRTPFQGRGYLGSGAAKGGFVTRDDAAGVPRVYFAGGDVVHRDADGCLTLVGRNDFQVKVRGTRVNVQEVEQVLLDHPDVVEAGVVAVPDELAGHRLRAFVRAVPGAGLGVLKLRRYCAQRLTRAAIPEDLRIERDALPRGATGKIDRAALRQLP